MNVDFQNISIPNYLAIHISAQKILQYNKYSLKTLILEKAEDGPFKYLVDSKWYSDKALSLACIDKKYQTPLMKMRSDERYILDKGLDYDLSLEKCGWLQ